MIFFFLQAQRPSIYQKMTMPADPLKEALKALENTCLSAKSEFFISLLLLAFGYGSVVIFNAAYSKI